MANAITTATTLIPNNKPPHSQQKVFLEQENPQKQKTRRGSVWQDKRRSVSARVRSAQPARSDIPLRAEGLNNNTPGSQNVSVHKSKKVKLTLWVEPIVKAEIQRRAEREQLSVSSVGAEALKVYLQHDADIHYSATLGPMIEATIDRRMSVRENRLALLLVRNCLATEQTRSLVTNILGRHPDISPDVLNDILDRSLQEAKRKITRRSPELEELIKEVKTWLSDLSGLPADRQGYRQIQAKPEEKQEKKP